MIRPPKADQDAEQVPDDADDEAPIERRNKSGRRGRGHWMMVICCVPMLAVAISLVAAGVVGFGFILIAVGCIVMMALMMNGMSRNGD